MLSVIVAISGHMHLFYFHLLTPPYTHTQVCHVFRYIITLTLPCGKIGVYCDVVECLPVDPATRVQFPADVFALHDNTKSCK